jgi:hypothetical protein
MTGFPVDDLEGRLYDLIQAFRCFRSASRVQLDAPRLKIIGWQIGDLLVQPLRQAGDGFTITDAGVEDAVQPVLARSDLKVLRDQIHDARGRRVKLCLCLGS